MESDGAPFEGVWSVDGTKEVEEMGTREARRVEGGVDLHDAAVVLAVDVWQLWVVCGGSTTVVEWW